MSKSVKQETAGLELSFVGKGMPRELANRGMDQITAAIGMTAPGFSLVVEALASRGEEIFVMVDGKPLPVADGARELSERYVEKRRAEDAEFERQREEALREDPYAHRSRWPTAIDADTLIVGDGLSKRQRAAGLKEVRAALEKHGRSADSDSLLFADFSARLGANADGVFFLQYNSGFGSNRMMALPVFYAVELLLSEESPERRLRQVPVPPMARPKWSTYPLIGDGGIFMSDRRLRPYTELTDAEVAAARARIDAVVRAQGIDPDAPVGQLATTSLLLRYRLHGAEPTLDVKDPESRFPRAWPFDAAVAALFSHENPELERLRGRLTRIERERASYWRLLAEESARRQRDAEREAREERLEAWAARPRAERAALVLAHTNPSAGIVDLGRAIAGEPETPTELPPDDIDLKC